MPVVIATWPRRLNHPNFMLNIQGFSTTKDHEPVIHDASAAFSGSESIAAQKYGPPDVGCALR